MKNFLLHGLGRASEKRKGIYQATRLARKLKYVAIISFATVLVVSVFLVWGAVSLVGHAAKSVTALNVQLPIESVVSQLQSTLARPSTGCLRSIEGVISERVLTDPIEKSMQQIKLACWNEATSENN